ncbi:hypothetical protein [Methylobacterium sp. J-068]|uniref:hypothetical protein n=1 Tax=Methylobacterium sp. J-068 TaxID=2836649 RepID=UPI001FB9C993|nr:hypothetical protein [Methylobacterium sp. J-068]MCJ2034536.1 hypothetical protein [Methylobacterium sp. J-068]
MRDEAAILEEMRLAVDGQKVGGEPTGWAGDAHADQMSMVLPFLSTLTQIATVRLVFRMRRSRPDRDCSATLVVTYKGADFCAWRMDWRPNAPHTNPTGPPELRGLEVETGVHDFHLNATLGLVRMHTEKMPICRPVDPPPNFPAFARAVYAMLNITPTEPTPDPPWSPRLF